MGPVPGMHHPQGKNFLLVSRFPAAAHPCRASVCAQAPLGRGWLHPFSAHHAALADSSKTLWHLLAESCSAWWLHSLLCPAAVRVPGRQDRLGTPLQAPCFPLPLWEMLVEKDESGAMQFVSTGRVTRRQVW